MYVLEVLASTCMQWDLSDVWSYKWLYVLESYNKTYYNSDNFPFRC